MRFESHHLPSRFDSAAAAGPESSLAHPPGPWNETEGHDQEYGADDVGPGEASRPDDEPEEESTGVPAVSEAPRPPAEEGGGEAEEQQSRSGGEEPGSGRREGQEGDNDARSGRAGREEHEDAQERGSSEKGKEARALFVPVRKYAERGGEGEEGREGPDQEDKGEAGALHDPEPEGAAEHGRQR